MIFILIYMLVLFYTANIYNPLQLSKQWAELFVADAIIMDFVGGLFDLSNPSMKKIEKNPGHALRLL